MSTWKNVLFWSFSLCFLYLTWIEAAIMLCPWGTSLCIWSTDLAMASWGGGFQSRRFLKRRTNSTHHQNILRCECASSRSRAPGRWPIAPFSWAKDRHSGVCARQKKDSNATNSWEERPPERWVTRERAKINFFCSSAHKLWGTTLQTEQGTQGRTHYPKSNKIIELINIIYLNKLIKYNETHTVEHNFNKNCNKYSASAKDFG